MNSSDVKAAARALGFEQVGICSASPPESFAAYRRWLDRGHAGTMDYLRRSVALRSDPARLLPGARSVVAVGLNYHRKVPPLEGRPRIAAYALGRDYHRVLRGRLRALCRTLAWRSGEFRICVDSAPILEREYAQRAGLGWFGKNTCLIDSHRGSWFFIGLVLTTHALEPDVPAVGGCGSCRLCIDACPTGAIVYEDETWQVDSRKCISYLTIEHRGEIDAEHQDRIGEWTFGCDICQEVCPFNQPRPHQPLRAQPTEVEDFRQDRAWPPLEELAEIDWERWDVITKGSAVRRAGLEGLRRNARINLRNRDHRRRDKAGS